MKRVLIAMLCAMLVPAAAAEQPAPAASGSAKKKASPPAPDTRKTIGLISNIGDKFTVQKIGIMVFGNEKRDEPIESWGIDAAVAAQVSSTFKSSFNVIPIKLSPAGKAALATPPGRLFGDRDGYVCDLLRKETMGQSFNYYLWVQPGVSAYSTTNQTVSGLGIVRPPSDRLISVYAIFDIELLDGRNCSVLRREVPPSTEDFLFRTIYGPSRQVDVSWMPAQSAVVQDNGLREVTKSLVENGLAQSLPRFFAPR